LLREKKLAALLRRSVSLVGYTQMEFCNKNLPDYPLFKVINMIYQVAPGVLKEHGKAKNPWPNVDAQSGVIQWYYGVTDYAFYTVLFGIARWVIRSSGRSR